jgi:hypothetical protein|tara:strand:- start:19460 stop:20077 length:618 start_codon:yes stop_codon:yes gene_type:complete
MRSKIEIQRRLATENDAFAIEVLRWVLSGGCEMCDHKDRKELEKQVFNEEATPSYLEAKYNWPDGTVMNHMDSHMEYDPTEAMHMEQARSQSINTLDSAEDIVIRIRNYLDELEARKEAEGGITSEFVTDASRLIAQANASLKLVGQLKKEIGVDSQLLLVNNQLSDVSRILVETLADQPKLLDDVERKLNLLTTPIDVDYEVVE